MLSAAVFKVAFVALSLGLDVFAVCIGVGMRGVDRGIKFRIGAAFAFAEVSMTLIGVAIGSAAGKIFGDIAAYFGFAALTLVGAYMIFESLRESNSGGFDLSRGWGLFLGAMSISLDSLGIGFSILFIGVPLVVSVVSIACASVAATTLGLTIGKALGTRMEQAASLWAGIILVATGVIFAALRYFGTGVSDALLAAVLAAGRRTIVVVGTAKNVGKTVTFNALQAAASRRGIVGAITSIGRDGEAADALDGSRKPRVRVQAGTIVALPRELMPRSPAFEILDLGEMSALGAMVFARARAATDCEIGGPPTARGVRATIDRLRRLTGDLIFVDGAIDRIAPLAGGDDAIVLATGGASGSNVAAIAANARATIVRLTLPERDRAHERGEVVVISGALDARDVRELLERRRTATIVVADPTRLAVRGKLLEQLLNAFDVRCERPLHVVACTTSTAGAGRALNPRDLVTAVAAATRLPAFDVVAGLAA